MEAAGACLLLALWMQFYFSFVSVLQQPQERQSKSECYRGRPASMEGRREQLCVYASARQTRRVATSEGRKRVRVSAKDNGFFSLFSRLKYHFFGWSPVDRVVAGINMDIVYLLAGDPRADLPRMIQVHLDDVMILFLRWLTEDDLVWPLQREVTKAALFREHYRYARQFLHEVSSTEHNTPEGAPASTLSVQAYRQISVAEARLRKWFFDGNTFVKRDGEGTKSDYLTEEDVDFMRGLPLNVLRIARGVFAREMPVTVARLSDELKARNITTTNQLLEKTNFVDFFALFDLFDEAFTQVDVLREFHRNWVNEGLSKLRQQALPGAQWTGPKNLTALVASPKASVADFPKCSTLKCYMRLKWDNTPTQFLTVKKTNVNSLKLLLVGNSGEGDPFEAQRNGWRQRFKTILGFNELQQTVAALKDWHTREKADAVLGLGSILGIPSATSVRSERFDTKWYNLFVKGAGLDVPWFMTVGEHEGVLSPATPIRYHYTLQQPNWHMPNDMYSVAFQFQADLTLENGAIQRDAFNVTLINLNTWALLAGNPITNNLQMQLNRMMWISRELYAATTRNSTWVIVMGHHPIISTGVEGKQARLQYVDDIYSSSHFRGWEHLVMHHLLFHYQVDAYISGHDYLMEYNTVEDLDKNTTISFINSGATARLMDRTIGRGWIGRLRGALYPILCFAGRRVFFLVDPGGCAPLDSEKNQTYGWFTPKFGNFKVNIVERAIRATGFTSLQLTKDFMVVEFIDGRTKKPATRRLQRRSNKAARDVTFADPVELGRKKYAEVRQKREEFVRANLDLLRKEIYFAKRCPILAERLGTYIREINSMADRHEKIRQENEVFQKMTEMEIEDAAAMGLDWDGEVEKANAEMRAVAKYYRSLKGKYADLLAFKDTLPTRDDPRYKELLQQEKAMMALKRKSLALVRQQGDNAPLEIADRYAAFDKKIKTLAATIEELEMGIRASSPPVSKSEVIKQEPQQATEILKEQLIDRLTKTEEHLRRLEETLHGISHTEVGLTFERAKKLHRHLETKLKDIRAQLVTHLEPLDPAFVWQKQQELHISEAKAKYMTDYLARTVKKSQLAPDTTEGDSKAVKRIRTESEELQDQVQKLKKMLEFRQLTPLQQQYLEKKTALALAELVQTQEDYLSGEEKDVQRVKRSLNLAAEAEKHLRAEVKQLEQKVKEELQQAITEWQQREHARKKYTKEEGTTKPDEQGANEALNRSNEMTEPTTAVNVGPPSTTTKTEKRRLSEMHSARATERFVNPSSRKYSTDFWRAVTEVGRDSLQPSVRVRSVTLATTVRKLSVHQSVEDSAEEAGTSEEESRKTEKSFRRPSEETSETERRLKRSSENHGETAEPQFVKVARSVESGKSSSRIAVERLARNGGTEGLEQKQTKDVHTHDAGDKAENAVKVTGPTPKAQTTLRKRKKGEADKGKTPEAKGRLEKKRDLNAKSKKLAGYKPPSVPKESEPEDEQLQDQLDKIDVGPLDECLLIPILDVMVRRALHPEESAESDTKCENAFSDRALSSQLKTLTVNQLLSKGSQGLGAGVHPVPSIHVSRGWRLYFQDNPRVMFKALMRDLKAGLSFVEQTFKRSTAETALRQKLHEKRVQVAKQMQTPLNAALPPPVSKTEKAETGETDEGLLDEEAEGQRPASESSSASDKPPTAPVTAEQPHASTATPTSKLEKIPPEGTDKDLQGSHSLRHRPASHGPRDLKKRVTDGEPGDRTTEQHQESTE